jgi:hypothetical protein
VLHKSVQPDLRASGGLDRQGQQQSGLVLPQPVVNDAGGPHPPAAAAGWYLPEASRVLASRGVRSESCLPYNWPAGSAACTAAQNCDNSSVPAGTWGWKDLASLDELQASWPSWNPPADCRCQGQQRGALLDSQCSMPHQHPRL